MKTLSAVTVFVALAAAGMPARATVIDTFSFAQGGYSGALRQGEIGALTGTFSGAVEANGYIELADLRSLTTFYRTGNLTLFGYFPARFFSYLPGSDSTLDLAMTIGTDGIACVGAVAAFGAFGCGAGGVNGAIVGYDTTEQLPTVTLISSVDDTPPPPLPPPSVPAPPQPVPEPSGRALLGLGLAAVMGLALRRQRGS